MKLMKSLIIGLIVLGVFGCADSPTPKKTIDSEKQSEDSSIFPTQLEAKGEVNLNFYKKKREAGIDFYAVGNEPFWALDMNYAKGFKFTTPEFEFNCPPVAPDLAQDAPVERYRAVTESGEIIIRLSKSGCTDNMSGQNFSHKVSVSFKQGVDNTYSEFTGCGRFVPDISLHDIWGLLEYRNNTYPNAEMPGGAQLELFPVDQRVIYSDGCNSFTGSFFTEGGKIKFGQMVGTLKACPDLKTKNEISSQLSQSNYQYQRLGNELLFSKDSTLIFRWRKID